jgi:hypothetical protein
VEIAGKCLDAIFNDVTIGKLGTVTIDPEYAGKFNSAPVIRNIVYVPESPLAASERGRINA